MLSKYWDIYKFSLLFEYFYNYFIIMIVMVILAVCFGRHKIIAWVLYTAGIAWQLINILGQQKLLSLFGVTPMLTWIIFLVIAGLGGLCVAARGSDA